MGIGPIALPILALVVYRTSGRGGLNAEIQPVDNPSPRYTVLVGERWFWTIFCAIVGCAAAWALTEALLSAWNTGLVSLPGRRRHPRPVVPWVHAWAYLSGLVAIATGTLGSRCLPRDSQSYPLYGLGAAVLVVVGYASVLFSEVLSSLSQTLFVLSLIVGVVAVFWVDRRYGRSAAVAVLVTYLCLFLYAIRGAI